MPVVDEARTLAGRVAKVELWGEKRPIALYCHNTTGALLRVSRSGLAMDNLESDWHFAPSSLALAETSGHVALRICAVDLKNAPQTGTF